jgi:hypothetical protein
MTYVEAMMDSDSEKWKSAMRSEIDSMDNNQVWNLVDPPDGVKPIECKWIYKKKRDMDGTNGGCQIVACHHCTRQPLQITSEAVN